MASAITARRFPVRLKAAFPKAASGEVMTLNTKPVSGTTYKKIVPFPSLSRERTKTKVAILTFPVRA